MSPLVLGISDGTPEGLPDVDIQKIATVLDTLSESVSSGDTERLLSLFSPDNTELTAEVETAIEGVRRLSFKYVPLEEKIRLLDDGDVRVTAGLSSSGRHWTSSRSPVHITLAKKDDRWLITATDFHVAFPAYRRVRSTRSSAGFRLSNPIPMIRNAAEDRSLWYLLLANVVVAILALALKQSLASLLLVYWIQSTEIGVMNVIRMLQLEKGCWRLWDPAFFVLHYGFFHVGYLLLILSDPLDEGFVLASSDIVFVAVSSAVFLGTHLFSYFYNRSEEPTKQSWTTLMFLPYLRMIPMTVVIMIGAVTGAGVVFWLGFKIAADMIAHIKQHEVLRRGTEKQDAQQEAPDQRS